MLRTGERTESLHLKLPPESYSQYMRVLDICQLPGYGSYEYKCFEALFGQPWFQRIWIVQEVAVAKKATVFFGEEDIEWEDLANAQKLCRRLGIMPMELRPAFGAAAELIETARLNFQAGKPIGLLQLLQKFRSFHATDPRDKAFALYGLAADCGPGGLDLKADYHLTKEEVFEQAAVKFIRQNLDIISVGFHPEQANMQLSSWVPDWSSRPGYFFPIRARDENGEFYCDYAASKNSPQEVELVLKTLFLQGHKFDIIHEIVSSMASNRIVRSDDLGAIRAFHAELSISAEWETLAKVNSLEPYTNGESNLDVYWQTLCANRKPWGHDGTKAAFLEWRKSHRPVRNMHRLCLNKNVKLFAALITLYMIFGGRNMIIPKSFAELMGARTDRQLARTKNGYLALVPPTSQPNDTIALIKGGKVPLVLREHNQHSWLLLGEAYVHGIMYGEAFVEAQCEPIHDCLSLAE